MHHVVQSQEQDVERGEHGSICFRLAWHNTPVCTMPTLQKARVTPEYAGTTFLFTRKRKGIFLHAGVVFACNACPHIHLVWACRSLARLQLVQIPPADCEIA